MLQSIDVTSDAASFSSVSQLSRGQRQTGSSSGSGAAEVAAATVQTDNSCDRHPRWQKLSILKDFSIAKAGIC
jgi:cation transport regulator ChaB